MRLFLAEKTTKQKKKHAETQVNCPKLMWHAVIAVDAEKNEYTALPVFLSPPLSFLLTASVISGREV